VTLVTLYGWFVLLEICICWLGLKSTGVCRIELQSLTDRKGGRMVECENLSPQQPPRTPLPTSSSGLTSSFNLGSNDTLNRDNRARRAMLA
nr:hypothetical protein [Tanacetum cinerariifolium]